MYPVVPIIMGLVLMAVLIAIVAVGGFVVPASLAQRRLDRAGELLESRGMIPTELKDAGVSAAAHLRYPRGEPDRQVTLANIWNEHWYEIRFIARRKADSARVRGIVVCPPHGSMFIELTSETQMLATDESELQAMVDRRLEERLAGDPDRDRMTPEGREHVRALIEEQLRGRFDD